MINRFEANIENQHLCKQLLSLVNPRFPETRNQKADEVQIDFDDFLRVSIYDKHRPAERSNLKFSVSRLNTTYIYKMQKAVKYE